MSSVLKSAGLASVAATTHAAPQTPPVASRAASVRPDVGTAAGDLAAAAAVDAFTAVQLLHDEINDHECRPAQARRLAAVVALLQRSGWLADVAACAVRGPDTSGVSDAPGWFASGLAPATVDAVRAVVHGSGE